MGPREHGWKEFGNGFLLLRDAVNQRPDLEVGGANRGGVFTISASTLSGTPLIPDDSYESFCVEAGEETAWLVEQFFTGGAFGGVVTGDYSTSNRVANAVQWAIWVNEEEKYGYGTRPYKSLASELNAKAGSQSLAIRKGCQYALVGDQNDDCRFDFSDVEMIVDSWLIDIDFQRFAEMAANWLIDCEISSTNPACMLK